MADQPRPSDAIGYDGPHSPQPIKDFLTPDGGWQRQKTWPMTFLCSSHRTGRPACRKQACPPKAGSSRPRSHSAGARQASRRCPLAPDAFSLLLAAGAAHLVGARMICQDRWLRKIGISPAWPATLNPQPICPGQFRLDGGRAGCHPVRIDSAVARGWPPGNKADPSRPG